MSALRRTAEDIVRRPPPAALPSERLLATERAAAQLEGRRIGAPRGVVPNPANPDAIDPAGLRRLLGTIWSDPRWNRQAAGVIAQARASGTRSLDRAIILAYLHHYPTTHAAFDDLRTAAAAASTAHDWAWAERGARWALWTDDGPGLVRDAVAAGAEIDPGLLRVLADSAFLAAHRRG